MTTTSMLHVRIDDELKNRATQALSSMGLTTADAVRLLFHRIAADQAFPLELKVPNTETAEAILEARKLISSGQARFKNAKALTAELDAKAG